MPWAGNIAKVMTSNGKQFTVTRSTVHCWPLLHVMAGISERFFKANLAFVLFCCITNHLMTGPLGNSEFCFPRISMFPSTSSRETLRISGNKIHYSPRDQSLSVYYLLRTEITKSHLNNRICQHCGVKTSTVTSSFYYVFDISLSCKINIPSFIGNLWWDLLLENHLNKYFFNLHLLTLLLRFLSY